MEQEASEIPVTPSVQSHGLRVYLLGPLRIERDGVRIHLPRRKVESLLAYLLLHPEQHGRDHLATLFWGDSADAQARHSLRTALALAVGRGCDAAAREPFGCFCADLAGPRDGLPAQSGQGQQASYGGTPV